MQYQQCKHNPSAYIGNKMLHISPEYLSGNQKVYVTGCEIDGSSERTMYTSHMAMHCVQQPEPRLCCNAPEADTKLWLHATILSREKHF